jgi:aminopeptidase-like protein
MMTEDILEQLFDELFPICRSITGEGIRRSLAIFQRHMPLEIETVPSGTTVFDWTVPPEWNIRSAKLTAPDGRVVADLQQSTLSVVNYSEPINRRLSLAELKPHLHCVPAYPDAIPYVTSYYKRTWGFCLPGRQLHTLKDGEYHAYIDSDFSNNGGVQFAHCVLPGDSTNEILLTSYLCHPSLANNELSGPLVLLGLFDCISNWPRRRFTYRFLLNPETIGSLCYLHRYADHLREKMVSGIVLTCLGGPSARLTYKLSRKGDGLSDRTVRYLRAREKYAVDIRPFDPVEGSDERQYCSPGFNLPVGQLARTLYGFYAGYHNSLDTKEFMGIPTLVQSIQEIEQILQAQEMGSCYVNLKPYGEPQLGPRGLYPNENSVATWTKSTDDLVDARQFLNRMLTVLNYADGDHDMMDIATRCGCKLSGLSDVVEKLEQSGLLAHKGR